MTVFPTLNLEEQKEARAFCRYSSSDFEDANDEEMFKTYVRIKEKRPDLLEEFRYYKKQMPMLGEIVP